MQSGIDHLQNEIRALQQKNSELEQKNCVLQHIVQERGIIIFVMSYFFCLLIFGNFS